MPKGQLTKRKVYFSTGVSAAAHLRWRVSAKKDALGAKKNPRRRAEREAGLALASLPGRAGFLPHVDPGLSRAPVNKRNGGVPLQEWSEPPQPGTPP